MRYAFSPVPQAALRVAGSDLLFPVRRIYCIGRNYAAHAREMGHDPDREPPFFFQKNPDNICVDGIFPYPAMSNDVHFEIELAVCLSAGGSDIPESEAQSCIYGYAVALDMTRRDLQGQAKKMGRPWEIGKSFDLSAPMSEVFRASEIGHPRSGEIFLDQNGARRQSGDLAQMIWSVGEQISTLSRFFTLAPGDVILTGTPEGVGPVARGDRLHGRVAGVGEIDVTVT